MQVIDIPETALTVKPNYTERPDLTVVAEIKAHIKQTGAPHLWPGHTHTKPPRGAIVRYLGEFDLPPSHAGPRNRERWAPCPCCKPYTPWYYKDGRIAWFPEERVIRNMGGDCFKSINASGHAEAERLFREEEAERRNEAYLLRCLPQVPEALAAIEQNAPIISEIDRVRFILSDRMTRTIGFDLWAHLRSDGVLRYEVTRTERRVDRSGNESTATVYDLERYGPLAGFEMLKPNVVPIAERVERFASRLRTLNFGESSADAVARMDRQERTRAAKNIGTIPDINELISEAETVRQMLSPLALGSLDGWSRTPGAPAKIYISLSDDRTQLFLGNTKEDARAVRINIAFFNNMRRMPAISRLTRQFE